MIDPRKRLFGNSRRNRKRRSGSVESRRRGGQRRNGRRGIVERLEDRQLLAVVSGVVFVDANDDGIRDTEEVGQADVRVYVDTNGNSQYDASVEPSTLTDELGQYTLDNLPAGDLEIRIVQDEGVQQTSPDAYFALENSGRELFQVSPEGDVTSLSRTSVRLDSITVTNDGEFFGVEGGTFGGVFRINPATGVTTEIFASRDFGFGKGITYDPQTDTLYTIAEQDRFSDEFFLFTVDQETGSLSRVSETGLTLSSLGVEDLAFDTVNRRVIGFGNFNDQFVEFDLEGGSRVLSVADQPISSDAIAFNGTEFVLSDISNVFNNFANANVDTGEITTGLILSERLIAESLHYAFSGNIAHQLTVADTDDIAMIDFGVAPPPPPPPAGSVAGNVWFDNNGNGLREFADPGLDGIEVYVDANDNGRKDETEIVAVTDEDGNYTLSDVPAGDIIVRQVIPRGFLQSSPAAYYGTSNEDTTRDTRLFEMSSEGVVRPIGQSTERPIYGLISTNEGVLYGTNFVNDTIYTIDPISGAQRTVAPLDIEVVAGLAYDRETDTIFTVGRTVEDPSLQQLFIFDRTADALMPVGTPLDGLVNVSDLAFDTVNNRIVGFDNGEDRFFEFTTDGVGTHLARTTRAFDSFSLAFEGSRFVMFDERSADGETVVQVNPDTGAIVDAFSSSVPVSAESLVYASRGRIAQRITVESDTTTQADFGLTSDRIGVVIQETASDTIVSQADRIDSFFVSLATRPTSNVVFNVVADVDTFLVTPDAIVFTPDDWDAPQLITIDIRDSALVGDHPVTLSVDPAQSDIDWRQLDDTVVNVEVEPVSDPDSIFINEIIDEASIRNSFSPYVELRGPEGGRIPDNTYLVRVNEDIFNEGEVDMVIDLSDQPLGQNGFLTLMLAGADYPVHPDSAILRSSTNSFGDLPGGIGETEALSGFDEYAFMLIQSDLKPILTDDVDVDADGMLDGSGANWNILDSVSLHDFFSDNVAYGDIIFVEDASDANGLLTRPGATIVVVDGDGASYAGRVGDSTGHQPEDWVGGTLRQSDGILQLAINNSFSTGLSPVVYQGLPLDHVGESNFVGGVRGVLFESPPIGDGPARDPIPAVGVKVFADTNGNGEHDEIFKVVDPDNLVEIDEVTGAVLENRLLHAADGVTISSFRNFSTGQFEDDVVSELQTNNNFTFENRIFATDSFRDYFYDFDKLRFDFFEPVSAVSIDAIANDSVFGTTYGRLDAYNANDELVAFVRSNRLVNSARETITIERDSADITYVMAYADDNFQNGSLFGRFDRLVYRQPEPFAITDDDGVYEITDLFPGNYDLTFESRNEEEDLVGAEPRPFEVTRYENFYFVDEIRANAAPTSPLFVEYLVPEDIDAGVAFGDGIVAEDLDGQTLAFSIPDATIDGRFETDVVQIDAVTGEISFTENAVPDFETLSEIVFNVQVTDTLGAFNTTSVTVTLSDVNEPPSINTAPLSIGESATGGSNVGVIEASDPDVLSNQSLTFQITGGSGIDVFDVNLETGLVSLRDDAVLDFETTPELTLDVTVGDNSDPPLFASATKVIQIVDENDPPTLATTEIEVAENTVGTVRDLRVNDQDLNQTHRFELVGGTGGELFRVTREGDVVVRSDAKLDFEAGSSYTLEVLIIDTGAPRFQTQQTVTITILDVNESAILNNESVSLPEDTAAGTLVTVVSARDPEGDPGDYSLQMLEEGQFENFTFDSLSGELRVAQDANLNFENLRTQSLRFEITDSTGESQTSQVDLLINIVDRNDAPVIITDQITVSEAAQPGDSVATIRAEDADRNDSISYAIVGGTAAGDLEIDADTGSVVLSSDASLDAESQDNKSIEVRVTDENGGVTNKLIEVRINDVNESPEFGTAPQIPNLESGEFLSVTLASDFVSDPEGDEFSIALFDETGSVPDWISYDPETRIISGTPSPKEVGTYQLTLRAFQAGLIDRFTDFNFTIDVNLGDSPFSHKRDPLDVDNNGTVTPSDALRVINFINRYGAGRVTSVPDEFNGFVDTTGEGSVTSLDALAVINELERRKPVQATAAVAEQIAVASTDSDQKKQNDEALVALLSESTLF